METLNLGIVAHVDAGKTSLTERLLFSATAGGDDGIALPGQIARVRGPHDIQIGDAVRAPGGKHSSRPGAGGLFAPPTLETAVIPAAGFDRVALHAALAQRGCRRAHCQEQPDNGGGVR